MAKFVKKGACTACGSEDNRGYYDDGSSYCFTPDCPQAYMPPTDGVPQDLKVVAKVTKNEMSGQIEGIKDRRISKETCARFGVTVAYGPDGSISNHWYPYFNMDTMEHTATKKRVCATKDFPWSGNRDKIGLFGQQTCRGGGKYITITEGECDALAVSEMFGNRWDVVSLKDGSSSAKRDIQSQLDFLESYETVVLCFDNDTAGQKAIDAVKDLFSPNKVKVCRLPMKDAGEMLQAGKVKEFTACWWDAKVYRPDGIISGTDTWDALVASRGIKSTPYPWQGLNELTKGHRPYELVTVTSGSGMGKSQLIRELEHDILQRCEGNIGVLALEESIQRTSLGIMSVAANRPLHLEEDTPVEDLKPFWEQTLGSGRYYLFDHFGSTSADNLLSRVRFMVKALDCRYIILDHLSIVVSSQDNGDERKAIDEIMTKLRSLVQETGCHMFLVSHLKRSGGTSHEEGGRVSLGELRGSQSIAQLSDVVIGLERNQQHENIETRNTTLVRLLKCRHTGETGPACYLLYDRETGRMREVPPPQDDAEVEF